MKKLLVFFVPLFAILLAWQTPAPTPNPAPNRPRPAPVNQDSLRKERQRMVEEVLAEIKGKENMRADSVFNNIKLFKNISAERMVRLMDEGWSKALGVGCNHCHNVNKWSDEAKPDKQLARDMAAMTNKINKEMLQTMKGLDEKSSINCTSCHMGRKHPAKRLD
ncbi:MAG: c-type cytochrome [Saprospiraceae bacterium]|nr:c-type cytochrome [Saprospiraceae bacterium]